MKRTVFGALLAAEAVLCVLLQMLQTSFSGLLPAAMAFPFAQIGIGLRALSLLGGAGNLAAILLYIALSLSPLFALLWLRKRGLHAEDGLLALLSILFFAVLYLMINPGLIPTLLAGTASLPIGKAVLGSAIYGALIGYLILRVLRLFFGGNTAKLQQYMVVLLGLLHLLFVYAAFGACFGDLLDAILTLQAGNNGNEGLLGMSYAFLALQYAVDALPYILDLFVVSAALRLLRALRADRYSGETDAAAQRLSQLCTAALAATILVGIAFQLLQLLFSASLMVVSSTVQIPLLSIVFVLGVLLLSRLITESKQLKDDNDMFI